MTLQTCVEFLADTPSAACVKRIHLAAAIVDHLSIVKFRGEIMYLKGDALREGYAQCESPDTWETMMVSADDHVFTHKIVGNIGPFGIRILERTAPEWA